ncbi:hypothetical protein [Mesorhizobium sp. M1403]|uniref:hypothetical protein n=1 Tax=Mesorhizobium sp. M1403 TaxID=2957097 RepID=UPI00333607C9
MSTNSDQLAILGQQVVDTLIATYNPNNDPSLALAIHPGQALADGIVQNGVTNPLRLSEWLEDQYDYPLWLKRSDASSVSASSVGSLTAKSAYLAMIPWAQPGVPVDAPSYARIAAMVAEARKDIGDNPDALPFSCEPTDFAEPSCTAWHVFDQRISRTTATTTETPGAIKANPHLWKMRVLTKEVVSNLTAVSEAVERRKAFAAELAVVPRVEAVRKLRMQPHLTDYATQPVEFLGIQDTASTAVNLSQFSANHLGGLTASPLHARALAATLPTFSRIRAARRHFTAEADHVSPPREQPNASSTQMQLDTSLVNRLATIQLHDLIKNPVVTEVTTSDSELHVHFEYCMLTITRRIAGTRWWHPDLVDEEDWYVPGMKRGDMIKASTDETYAHCLPQGLLLVRNVEFSGSWTAEARTTMQNAVSFLGPFLMQAPTDSTSSTSDLEQISVLGVGVQVIGELCFPLPPLPPMDDPAESERPVV